MWRPHNISLSTFSTPHNASPTLVCRLLSLQISTINHLQQFSKSLHSTLNHIGVHKQRFLASAYTTQSSPKVQRWKKLIIYMSSPRASPTTIASPLSGGSVSLVTNYVDACWGFTQHSAEYEARYGLSKINFNHLRSTSSFSLPSEASWWNGWYSPIDGFDEIIQYLLLGGVLPVFQGNRSNFFEGNWSLFFKILYDHFFLKSGKQSIRFYAKHDTEWFFTPGNDLL